MTSMKNVAGEGHRGGCPNNVVHAAEPLFDNLLRPPDKPEPDEMAGQGV
jgi:hypothetical protein